MKAIRGNGAGGVSVIELEEPPGVGEIAEVRSASICGSDFGYLAFGTTAVLGRELAGVGEDERVVAVEAIYGCGTCDACCRGAYKPLRRARHSCTRAVRRWRHG